MKKEDPTIHKLIGDRFEKIFGERYKGFTKVESEREILPDFYILEYDFWTETKTGNIEWGARLKERQTKNFCHLKSPVIYCIGYHNFNNARERLKGRTVQGKRNYLARNMDVLEIYFIANSLVEKVWEKENRLNERGTQRYCMFKKHIMNRLFYNKEFISRFTGKKINSEDYYEYNSEDFLIVPEINGSDSWTCGVILQKEGEEGIMRYLGKELVYGPAGI